MREIDLQKQREAAKQEVESALQVQLAQNSLQAAKQKQAPTRPSVDRLNIEERIAAVSCSLVGITQFWHHTLVGITQFWHAGTHKDPACATCSVLVP